MHELHTKSTFFVCLSISKSFTNLATPFTRVTCISSCFKPLYIKNHTNQRISLPFANYPSCMDHEPQSDCTLERRRRGSGKIRNATSQVEATTATEVAAQHGAPCGACKFLRRKCVSGCVFAPHFGSDQGAARFAAVHKVFGASNVSKLLLHIPANRRHDAVVTISYEAQARLSDPVYGCVSTIIALQQQVSSLQGEMSMVQTQLINSKLASSNAFQNSAAPQHHHPVAMLHQPAYSNTSSASNNLIFGNTFVGPNFGETTATSTCFEPGIHHLYNRANHGREEDDEDDEETHDQVSFTNHIFQ